MKQQINSGNNKIIYILCSLFRTLILSQALHVTRTKTTTATTESTVTSSHGNVLPSNEITVWDNVLPSNVLLDLHKEATKVGLGHKAFARPFSASTSNFSAHDDNDVADVIGVSTSKEPQQPRPLIELVLDQILTELGDDMNNDSEDNRNTTQYVEYWTRQEWRHIEAHADVDEILAKEEDKDTVAMGRALQSQSSPPFRYPSNGHVLYLKVGSEVRGPTCLFPDRSSGGDLLKLEENTASMDGIKNNNNGAIDLVTVPAVEGRLLRFDGSTLHAVPRPADLWFLPFVKGAPAYTPEESWGRSVILFNTWHGDPPKDVPLDNNTAQRPDDNDDEEDIHTNTNANNSQNSVGVRINTFSEWDNIFSLEGASSSQNSDVCNEDKEITYGRPAKIWLLGNERRRDYRMRTIKLNAPEETRDLLSERHSVSRVQLSF